MIILLLSQVNNLLARATPRSAGMRIQWRSRAADGWQSGRVTEYSGAPCDTIRLVVVGAHLSGQPLNHQLLDRGAVFVASVATAPEYRLYALSTDPPKPGLVRVAAAGDGRAIEAEVWELTAASFGDFVDAIPSPLGIGRVLLDDGTEVAGFICEPIALDDATEISEFGGWRAYLAASD